MNKLSLFLLIFLVACSHNSSPHNINELEDMVTERLNELEGDFAFVFQNLKDSTDAILINPDERFHAASTMKTPVLLEIYKQSEEGKFSVDDSIEVHNEFESIVDGSSYSMQVSEDSESELYDRIGSNASIYDLSSQMMTHSSNLATNILIDLVGAENVTETMRELGADSIEVLRGVEDLKAYEAGLSNTTTARDLLIMFESIASNELLSEESNGAIISILKGQVHNDMFPAKLPDDAEVAHKTGWITNVHHDSGIIYLPDGKAFVLVFLSKNAPDREKVQEAAADFAKWSYDYIDWE